METEFKKGRKMKIRRRVVTSPKSLEFGHLTLLFCTGRQRNVPTCKTHVQSVQSVQGCCFFSLKPLSSLLSDDVPRPRLIGCVLSFPSEHCDSLTCIPVREKLKSLRFWMWNL